MCYILAFMNIKRKESIKFFVEKKNSRAKKNQLRMVSKEWRNKRDRKVTEVVSNSNQHKYDRNQWNNNVVRCASVLWVHVYELSVCVAIAQTTWNRNRELGGICGWFTLNSMSSSIQLQSKTLRCVALSWLELSQHHIKLNNNNRTTRNSCLFIISIIIMGSVLVYCVCASASASACAYAYALVWSLSVCIFQFNCCIYFHLWSIFFFLFLSFVA